MKIFIEILLPHSIKIVVQLDDMSNRSYRGQLDDMSNRSYRGQLDDMSNRSYRGQHMNGANYLQIVKLIAT